MATHAITRGRRRIVRRATCFEALKMETVRKLRPLLLLVGTLGVVSGCGDVTSSIDADGGLHDALATHHDSAARVADGGTGTDGRGPETPDAGGADAGEEVCPKLPPDAGVQCGKPCAFPGYFAPCPPDPGNPIGVSCGVVVDGGGPVWSCSEG